MDLAPFLRINPCGYTGLTMTQMVDQISGQDHTCTVSAVGQRLQTILTERLGYNAVTITEQMY
jgi:lipoyl(octanoyl) transferase